MGDPFSVAASTASFVSLGLQVCGGLISYCRAWKSHDKEIEEALEKLSELQLTLETLSDTLTVVESLDDSAFLGGARQQIRSCTVALNKLHGILIEAESISQPSGILDKLHNLRLRSTFLFNREKLKCLRDSTAESQSNLGNAIQFLSLRLVIKQNISLEKLVRNNEDKAIQIPDKIENALIRRLDMLGQNFCDLRDGIVNASSEHAHNFQQVKQDISTLQLEVISKPSLLRSVYEKDQRLEQTKLRRRDRQSCTCPSWSTHKILFDSRSYQYDKKMSLPFCRAAIFTSNFVDRQNFPSSEAAEEVKQVGFRLSFSGPLLRGAIQAAFSMTRGYGGFSISPTLAFIPTVSSDSAAFKLLDITFKENATAADMQQIFFFSKQKLSHLYQDGKASPRDVDEDGNTILHKACQILLEFHAYRQILMDNNTIDVYFKFLQDIYEMGAPLNRLNTAGMTPLGSLLYNGIERAFSESTENLVNLLNSKMLDLGAEYPLFTSKTLDEEKYYIIALADLCGRNPDILEATESNDISLAISTRSWYQLVEAVRNKRDSIDQPNVLGHTPLHHGVRWPKAIRLLLDNGAAVDALDALGFTPIFYAVGQGCLESVQILAEAGCVLFVNGGQSLLEHIITWLEIPYLVYGMYGTYEERSAIIDCVIWHVAERRRKLTALARSVLDGKDFAQLGPSAKTILDSKAPLALSLLQRKIDVPRSLFCLSPVQCCVYHIPSLRARQAQSLWDAGFRDIDELDSFGQSPLMKDQYSVITYRRNATKVRDEFTDWLLLKGANLHCRQSHAFQKPVKSDCNDPTFESCKTNRSSAATATHYLAALWGLGFYTDMLMRWCEIDLGESAWNLKYTLRKVLSDPITDDCNCACSVKGCTTFTMMMKPADEHRQKRSFRIRRAIRRMTRSTAHLLDADLPDFAWLRHEMLRFNTFERLRLRHTCCTLCHTLYWAPEELIHRSCGQYIIAELDDDERCEIMEEQVEQVERLEVLLVEFEKKFDELGIPFVEFLDGYWDKRMAEISKGRVAINQAELERTGVILRRTSSWSSIILRR